VVTLKLSRIRKEEMQRVRIIEHKGKKVFYVDFSNCTSQEAIETLDQARKTLVPHPHGSLLGLTDVTNGHFDRKVTQELKEYSKFTAPYMRASALVGVTGIKKAILIAVETFTNRRFTLFDDVEKAKDWLVEN
jgi:hypothetical protein